MDEADVQAGRRIACPTLVLHGATSHMAAVFDQVAAVWRDYAPDLVGGPVPSGHDVPEHAPGQTLDWFLRFFGRPPG